MGGLRGESPEHVLLLLREIEKGSSSLKKATFSKTREPLPVYLHGGWLKVGHQSTGNVYTLWSIVGLVLRGKFRSAAAAFSERIAKPMAVTDVAAARVRVKNNVLAVYPESGLVCKFEKQVSIREADSLQNEYKTLCEISAFSGLQAPEPVAYQNEPVPTLWMKYVDHRKVGREEVSSVAFRIAGALFGWYDHCGVSQTTSASYSPLAEVLEGGVDLIIQKGWDEAEADKLYSGLGILAGFQTPLLVSRIHGDASTGNAMITPSGHLVVNDWETSRVDIVAYDMDKLFLKNPDVEELYSRWRMGYVAGHSTDISRELALVRILRGLDLGNLWRYWAEVMGLSHEQATSRIETHKSSVVAVCNAVAIAEDSR